MLAGPLGLQGTLLLGGILHNGLGFVVTLLGTLLEATASGGTELPGLLGTSGDGGVLLHLLLGDGAHLPWPLGALGVGGVARGLVLTLLFDLGGALHHVLLHLLSLLLGPALGLVHRPADLFASLAGFLQRLSADVDSLIPGGLLVGDEAGFPEVLLTLLLLL